MAERWIRLHSYRLRRRLLAGATAGVAIAVACGGNGTPKQRSKSTGAGGAAASSGAPQTGGTLAIAQINNAPTLDLHRTTSGYTKSPAGAVLSRLLRYKTGPDPNLIQDHQIEGDLALSAESPDAVTWTVKLRRDAKFQNIPPVSGHPVEAEDVKATFVRALGADNPNRAALDMIDPAQIEAPSRETVVFTLKYAYAPFKSTLASPNYSWILPREAAAGDYDPAKQLIGSGPFPYDSFTPDVAFTFRRNPEWFEKGQPYVDVLKWSIIPDASQLKAQFTGGHLDVLGSNTEIQIAAADVDSLKGDNPKALLIKGSPGPAHILYLQLGDLASPFQDVRVRRAFSMAIDRNAIAKTTYVDQAEPDFNVPPSLGKWALTQKELSPETARYYKYDPAEAKKLLQAAGAADLQFKLIFSHGYLGPEYEKTAETIANMLNTAGIKTTLVAVDYQKDFIAGGKGIRYGNYAKDSVVLAGISGYDEADEYIFNYFSSKTATGPSRLHDSQLDGMLGKARAVVNDDERLRAYKDIQKYMADSMFTVAGLRMPYRHYMVQSRVQSYQHSITYGVATETFAKLWLRA